MNLIATRLNLGLSVAEAAERMGIARNTLAKAERGERIHPGSAKTIADFYGKRVTDIWPIENDEPMPLAS